MDFRVVRPCKHCPFRKDIPIYLSHGRIIEIVCNITEQDKTFACHETVDYSEGRVEYKEAHCAGAAMFVLRSGRPNAMLQIAERLGLFDPRKLKGQELIYSSLKEWLQAYGQFNTKSKDQ